MENNGDRTLQPGANGTQKATAGTDARTIPHILPDFGRVPVPIATFLS